MEICGRIAPLYKEVEDGHFCACHLYNTVEETEQLELKYEEERKAEEARKAELEKKQFWTKWTDKLHGADKNNNVVSPEVAEKAEKAVSEALNNEEKE